MAGHVISGPFVGSAARTSWAERIATSLYHSTRRLQLAEDDIELGTTSAVGNAIRSAAVGASQSIKLVCISDTHNTFPADLPDGDILVHAGDLSQYGTFTEIQKQLDWIRSQPHAHKVVIGGNHDLLLDAKFVAAHPDRELDRHQGQRRADLDWTGIHYLEHELLELFLEEKKRTVCVFGSPWTPKHGYFAFQYQERDGFTWSNSMPPNTDLMVVHGPPKGHLDDGGKGCQRLLEELWRARPAAVVCGHIHPGRGGKRLIFDANQASYEAAICASGIWAWISLVKLALCFGWCKLWASISQSSKSLHDLKDSTYLVNAAMVGGRGQSERRDAITVII